MFTYRSSSSPINACRCGRLAHFVNRWNRLQVLPRPGVHSRDLLIAGGPPCQGVSGVEWLATWKGRKKEKQRTKAIKSEAWIKKKQETLLKWSG